MSDDQRMDPFSPLENLTVTSAPTSAIPGTTINVEGTASSVPTVTATYNGATLGVAAPSFTNGSWKFSLKCPAASGQGPDLITLTFSLGGKYETVNIQVTSSAAAPAD